MKHISEEELVLYYYGEDDVEGVKQHLDSCESCNARLEHLRTLLGALDQMKVPERGESYGQEVWQRLSPKLSKVKRRARTSSFRLPTWAIAAVVALVVGAAFLTGRFWEANYTSREPISVAARQRLLIAEVGEHLERSEIALIDLANRLPEEASDIADGRKEAEDLLIANRIYRQTAAASGQLSLANVLEELERTLIEIAHSPLELSSTEQQHLTQSIRDLLFKVRVIQDRVQELRHKHFPATQSSI